MKTARRHHRFRHRTALTVAVAVLCATLASCAQKVKPEEVQAAIRVADLVTVHYANRLMGRLLAAQRGLREGVRTDPNLPSLLGWHIIEPSELTDDHERLAADIDPFPPLVALAVRDVEIPVESAPSDGTAEPDPTDTRTDDATPAPESPEGTNELESSDAEDIADEGAEGDEGVEPEYDRLYLAVLPQLNSSNAGWPVVIVDRSGARVVAANLRDYFAGELMAYQPTGENATVWQELAARLWNDLRLGIADPEETQQRNAQAIDASDVLLTIE